MAYTKQNFKTGTVLEASHLNHIEDGIGDLHNLLEYTTPVDEVIISWTVGGINTNTGEENSHQTNRTRTEQFIPINASLITAESEVRVLFTTYDFSYKFTSATSWVNLPVGVFDISILSLPEDTLYYKIVMVIDNAETGAEISSITYPYDGVREGIIPDIEQLQEIVGVPSEAQDYTVVWEVGGIMTTTGVDGDNSERRRTKGYIPISATALSSTESVSLLFIMYDEDKNYISALPGIYTFTTFVGKFSLTTLRIPSTAAYYRILMKPTDGQTGDEVSFQIPAGASGGLLKKVNDLSKKSSGSGKPNEIIVDCNGSGDYLTIEEALAEADDTETNHVIIRVMQGTYFPPPKTPTSVPYREGNRNLSIIGDNRNKCILRGDDGYYYAGGGIDYGVLRLSGNVTIENLTIESYCSNYETVATENGYDLSSPHCRAYCIHVDTNRREGDMVLIRNCKLINDHFTTVGFGLRQNSTLRFENCDMIMTINDNSLSGGANYGTLYGHLAAGTQALNQRLEVINCRIVNNSYSQAINLMDGSAQTEEGVCSASVQLIGNVCKTTDTTNCFVMDRSHGYWTMDDLCYGNNVAKMNGTQ